MSVPSLLIVDCQYDFIDGSLACEGALEAVDSAVAFINARPDVATLYSVDWHSPANRSFLPNGGIWPPHCIAGGTGLSAPRKVSYGGPPRGTAARSQDDLP